MNIIDKHDSDVEFAKLNELSKLDPENLTTDDHDLLFKASVWLASDDSDYVHGVTLFVDGGMLLYPGFATGG